MSRYRLTLFYLVAALLRLWLRGGVPAAGLPFAADDDGLFVALARHLGAGQWLGPLDDKTLVKGMAYPLFIVVALASGLPLKIAEHVVYLVAAFLMSLAVRRATGYGWLALAVFVALAFNPVLWTAELARVIREGLYIGLSPMLVALAALALFGGAGDGCGSAGRSPPARRGPHSC